MESFLKTLLIVLLVYFALRFVLRLAAPYMLKFVAKKMSRRFEQAFQQAGFDQDPFTQKSQNSAPKSDQKLRTNGKVVGEYIDFEELD